MTSPTAQKAARTPDAIHGLFKEYLEAGDLDGITSLYEADAVVVTGPGESATGLPAIREFMAGFVALKAKITFQSTVVTQAGELALVHAAWTGKGTSPEGPVEFSGLTSEVVRKQADGTWLYVIDNPGMGVSQG